MRRANHYTTDAVILESKGTFISVQISRVL